MNELIFLLGTLATWTGLGMAVWLAFTIGTMAAGSGARRPMVPAIGAVVGLGFGALLTSFEKSGLQLPIVWVILPFAGWAALTCLLLFLYNASGLVASFAEERVAKAQRCGLYGLGALAFLWLLIRDTDRTERIVKGAIPLSPIAAAIGLSVMLLMAFVLGFTADRVRARGIARGVILHTVLILGSFFFCIPFFYLLSTSFKEDRDMSSPDGVIWIPRVQRTVPYFNPKEPLYETVLDGDRVEGVIIQRQSDGRVRLDISRPFALRGKVFDTEMSALKEIPRAAPLVSATIEGTAVEGQVLEDLEDGRKRVLLTKPSTFAQRQVTLTPDQVQPIRDIGLRWQNYTEAIEFMPPETQNGWMYVRNTLVIVILSVIGTVLSSSIVAYAFSRMRFPWRDQLFAVLLATMMLPGAVTMMPKFLIFRSLGWIDTLYPLWAPAFFASAFNVFMLRQFFKGIPMELEEAAKIDGCSYLKTFWNIMLPMIMPALSVIFIWTFTGAWNDFQGPLIYINSPENMPLSYALQLFSGDRSGEPGLMMAFATMTLAPIVVLFFAMQRYFIEGVTLSGFGGR
jgi:multiple sugar transport system permease protein